MTIIAVTYAIIALIWYWLGVLLGVKAPLVITVSAGLGTLIAVIQLVKLLVNVLTDNKEGDRR